jgi:hypothetical protein
MNGMHFNVGMNVRMDNFSSMPKGLKLPTTMKVGWPIGFQSHLIGMIPGW